MDEEMEKQKDAEKENDSVDGLFTRAAETSSGHRVAGDKRYNTMGYQKKKQRPPVDFSTVSKGTYGLTSVKPRAALKQSLFQSEKSTTQEGSVEALKQTLEICLVPNDLSWRWGEGNNSDVLENSWTDLVDHVESMSKTQRHQQEALWELIHTEIVYINKLTIVTDLVMAALDYVHERGFLQEVSSDQLFSNLPSILSAHRLFWQDVMYPMLQHVRQTRRPFDPLKLEPGCLQFTERFSAYMDYCWEEDANVEFTRRQMETNPYFNIFLTWVETHPQCGRMRLGDMQAKPHQRITKYPLLLKAILKTTEDAPRQHALERMLTSVSQFLDSINDYLQFKYDELALFDLSQRIEGYELQGMNEEIDKHMQELCCFDLTSPIRGIEPKVIRKLLMEETMKVRGRKDNKLEVAMLLFTDVLLLTKNQKKSEKQKVVQPPLSLERIRCAELKDGYSFVLVDVSDLGCAVNVYSVSAPSPESCSSWVLRIQKAQRDLEILRKQEILMPSETTNPDELEESGMLPSASREVNKDRWEQPEDHEETKTGDNGYWEESSVLQGPVNERRVTWSQVSLSPTPNGISKRDLPERSNSNGSHPLLVGGLVKKALPRQSSSSSLPLQSVPMSFEPAVRNTQQHLPSSIDGMKQQDSKNQLQKSESCQDFQGMRLLDGSENHEDSWRFFRKIKSPRLRRKRPISSQPHAALASRRMSDGADSLKNLRDRTYSSNSDSDGSNRLRILSNSSTSTPQDTHLVLKLGSLKQNRDAFWNISGGRLSPDLQTLSEPELSNEKLDQNFLKIAQIKNHRSSSTPEVVYPGDNSQPKGLTPSCPSPLQDLLERAKERERERGIAKREGKTAGKRASPLHSHISSSTTPSPSPSESEQAEADGFSEKKYSYIGKESSVDDVDSERKNSPDTPLGASVDWPGWCFDDEEVLEFLGPRNEIIDWFDQNLTGTELQTTSKPEEGECSEV